RAGDRDSAPAGRPRRRRRGARGLARAGKGDGVNRDRSLLLAYLAAVVAASLVHDTRLLASALVLALASAGGRAGRLARRALRATGPYLAAVAGGWLGLAAVVGPTGVAGEDLA